MERLESITTPGFATLKPEKFENIQFEKQENSDDIHKLEDEQEDSRSQVSLVNNNNESID